LSATYDPSYGAHYAPTLIGILPWCSRRLLFSEVQPTSCLRAQRVVRHLRWFFSPELPLFSPENSRASYTAAIRSRRHIYSRYKHWFCFIESVQESYFAKKFICPCVAQEKMSAQRVRHCHARERRLFMELNSAVVKRGSAGPARRPNRAARKGILSGGPSASGRYTRSSHTAW